MHPVRERTRSERLDLSVCDRSFGVRSVSFAELPPSVLITFEVGASSCSNVRRSRILRYHKQVQSCLHFSDVRVFLAETYSHKIRLGGIGDIAG